MATMPTGQNPTTRQPVGKRILGDGRFLLERRLGTGGAGSVYAAYDRRRREHVALKTVNRRRDAEVLYAFKREFRTLSDVAHPNLVALYELFADDRQCFFTMELVDGVDFLGYVRPEGVLDEDRLRRALAQLAAGVSALHDAARLHRDLKPSNVMLTFDGRLVILDFGLALDRRSQFQPQSFDGGFAGTLVYMAPEQANGEPSTPATDWYALGGMLFEALTGRPPFDGSLVEILNRKLRGNPPDPRESADEELPEDLARLCRHLLARAPGERPPQKEIRWRLSPEARDAPESLRKGSDPNDPADEAPSRAFIGRERELAVLEQAWATTRRHQAVAVYLHGESGMGKTSLVRRFLGRLVGAEARSADNSVSEISAESEIVILTGRCYERELVPYKALDGVIDSLSRFLNRHQERLEPWLPRDLRALTRLFPVLRRVEPVERIATRGRDSPDRLTLRRRAFTALRQLLRRVAEDHPLVLSIDDLQWADADSALLLQDLLREPEAPPLLLVASFRSEEIEGQPFLRHLLDNADDHGRHELALRPLEDHAAGRLADLLLGDSTPGLEGLRRTIVQEAAGSPFFVEQLATYVLASDSTLSSIVNLGEMLEQRVRHLPEGTRALLETLAVASGPLDARLAFEAADLEGDERPVVAALRSAKLTRSSGSAYRIEIYHDRLRETVADRLSPAELRQGHQRLADTLIRHGVDDPEALFEHLLGAGQHTAAADHALRAAHKASTALAFDRAALFYARVLELGQHETSRRQTIQRQLAECLGNAGRPEEAANAFLAAAELAEGREALECRNRAAKELLAGGYFDAGARLVAEVLVEIDEPLVEHPLRAVLSLLWQRWLLRRRGLDFTPRPAEEAPQADLMRIDSFWAVASSLVTVRPVQGADFQTRHLRHALDAGEPVRIARALAIETSFVARRGERARQRAEALCETALDVASRVDDPFALAIATLHSGISAYLLGDWRPAVEQCDEADRIFQDRCQGVLWDQNAARRYALSALIYRGAMDELRRRVTQQLVQARERGNVMASTELCTRVSIAWLAADDPEGSLLEIDRELEPWDGFHLPHYNGFWGRNQADLYRGDRAAAWRRLETTWPRLERTLLLQIQLLRIEALCLRGRTALAWWAEGGDPKARDATQKVIRRLEREKVAYGTVLADLLTAGLAHRDGRPADTREALERAAWNGDECAMDLHATVARYVLGALGDDPESRRRHAESESWMKEHGIVRPDRMAAMMAPGFE